MSGIIAQNTLGHSGLIKSPEAAGGAWNHIKKLTASDSATLSFVDGSSDVVLDSTYIEYVFYFKNILPATDGQHWTFNVSIDGGSNYNVAKTGGGMDTNQNEAGTTSNFRNNTNYGGGQATGAIQMVENAGNGADEGISGYFHLFNPASTVFIKHYVIRLGSYQLNNETTSAFSSGYANTTSAVDAIQFAFASGNIASGDIFMHGLSTT